MTECAASAANAEDTFLCCDPDITQDSGSSGTEGPNAATTTTNTGDVTIEGSARHMASAHLAVMMVLISLLFMQM
jgi:hypothetical protein